MPSYTFLLSSIQRAYSFVSEINGVQTVRRSSLTAWSHQRLSNSIRRFDKISTSIGQFTNEAGLFLISGKSGPAIDNRRNCTLCRTNGERAELALVS